MKPCDHKGTINTAPTCPGYQAYCSVCSCIGHPYRNHEDAVRELEQRGLEALTEYYYDNFIAFARDVGVRDPFQLVEKPRTCAGADQLNEKYTVNATAGDIRNSTGVIIKQYMTVEDAQKFKEKLMATVAQTPYWIIVSDEGPADKPRRHSSKSSAETEAQRLTEKHPGREFTVFQAVSSVLTPKAETKKTEYREVNYWAVQSLFYNPYDPRN